MQLCWVERAQARVVLSGMVGKAVGEGARGLVVQGRVGLAA